MKTLTQFREKAELLREASGSTNLEKTLLKALKVLKLFNVPHYACGGSRYKSTVIHDSP
jgi:hypothetical protein